MRWFTLLFLLPAVAHADLYVTKDRDGVVSITNQGKPRGSKVLYTVKEESKKTTAKGSTKTQSSKGGFGAKSKPLARPENYAGFVKAASVKYSLPEALIWAVIKVESGFNPYAVSNVGAQGLMQLMPNTCADLGVTDPYDPAQNINGGSRLLRMLANRFDGDLVLTLSGYHAGGGATHAAGGIPYDRTSQYVGMVLKAYYAYKRELPVDSAEVKVEETPLVSDTSTISSEALPSEFVAPEAKQAEPSIDTPSVWPSPD